VDVSLTNDRGDAVDFNTRLEGDRTFSEIRWANGSITEIGVVDTAAWGSPS
jgi:hypothetical protein